jgi:hypothetical protein
MAIQIICINKSGGNHADPHHAIEYLGWMDGSELKKISRLALYDWLKESGNHEAYVEDTRGNRAYVGTREHANGTKYLQTYADGKWTDNLLPLKECK